MLHPVSTAHRHDGRLSNSVVIDLEVVLRRKVAEGEVDYALKLGARAVVSKADPPEEIIAACEAALAGDIYISPHMRDALGKYRQPPVALSSRQMAISAREPMCFSSTTTSSIPSSR